MFFVKVSPDINMHRVHVRVMGKQETILRRATNELDNGSVRTSGKTWKMESCFMSTDFLLILTMSMKEDFSSLGVMLDDDI